MSAARWINHQIALEVDAVFIFKIAIKDKKSFMTEVMMRLGTGTRFATDQRNTLSALLAFEKRVNARASAAQLLVRRPLDRIRLAGDGQQIENCRVHGNAPYREEVMKLRVELMFAVRDILSIAAT